jgi:type IV pilus assembly protein PilQ
MQAKFSRLAASALASILATAAAAQGETVQDPESGVQGLTQQGDRASRLNLRLRDRLLRDVVQSISRQAGVNIVIDPGIEDRVTIDLEDVEWRQALDLVVEAAGCVVVRKGTVLKVEKPPRVYFAFENADVQKVIDTIAKISGANIVVAPEVQGSITLRLRDIPWRDALDATAKTLGFVVVEEDRLLRVVPPSIMQQDLLTKHFQLRYVRPQSAYMPFLDSEYVDYIYARTQLNPQEENFSLLDALRNVLTPEIGTLQYHEGQNLIIVKDTKPVVEEIERIVQSIDVEPAQVYIDVKFVTTTNSDILDVGVSPGANGWTASMNLGQIPHRMPFDLGPGGWDDDFIANDSGTGPFADQNLNPTGGTSMPDVVFGALNFTEVSATLRLLRKDSRTEIAQAPQLIALDHQIATIFVGETIRYAQARSEQGQAGGLQLVVEEAPDSPVSTGFQLLVIPHIVPGTDKIIMDIIPKSESLSGTGTSTLAPAGFDVFTVGSGTGEGSIALPRIASSTIATKVLLRSGQTAVLGGLVTDTDSVTETKLPLLGDIPILGWLFKNQASSKSKSTLIVFVTPQVIRSPEDIDQNVRAILDERQKLMQGEYEAIFGKGEGR